MVVFKLVNIVKFSDVYGFFVFSRQTNYIVILTQLQLTHNKCHMVIWFSKSATRDILGSDVSCSPEKTFEYFTPKNDVS